MPQPENWDLITIADNALTEAYGELAKDNPHAEMVDYPPSALIACLMAHAQYEGWDFLAACRVARTFGPAPCFDILPARSDHYVTAHAVDPNDGHRAATIEVRDYSKGAAMLRAKTAAAAIEMDIHHTDQWPA